jgi:uncharacterized protein YprB with RNaseH-like and TPR domain
MQNNQFIGGWTKEERKILIKNYPLLGSKVIQLLPNRTKDAIDREARSLGLHYGLFPVGEEAFFDIETTNLKADFSYMISWALKIKGTGEIYSDSITKKEIFDEKFDERIVKSLIDTLISHHIKRIYTYYGTKFDIPYFRTRALKWNLDFPVYGVIQHQDIYYLVKSKLCFSSNRLEKLCEFLGIDGKTKLDGGIWVKAAIGNKECIKYILDHNVADVVILEKAFDKIKNFVTVQKRSI